MIENNKCFGIFVFTCIVSSSYCDHLLRTKRNFGENHDLKTDVAETDIGNKKHAGSPPPLEKR